LSLSSTAKRATGFKYKTRRTVLAGYADDIVVIAETEDSFKKKIEIVIDVVKKLVL